MQQYKILIVVNADSVQAADIDDHGKSQPISINGNVSMNYAAVSDMEKFVDHIKGNYNIDDFSDDNFSVIIINCDGDRNAVQTLYRLTTSATDSNIINAEYVLPFIAVAKEKLRKGQTYKISVCETSFTLTIAADGHTSCIKSDFDEKADITLELNDFAILFSADISRLGNDEETLRRKNEEIERLSKDYEQQLTAMKSQAEKETARLKMELEKCRRKRSLCWSGTMQPGSRHSYSGGIAQFLRQSSSQTGYRREMKMLRKNGDAVKDGDRIAAVSLFEGRATVTTSGSYYIYARQDGKVFYLTKDSKDTPMNTPVAIIADKDDTQEDAMEWFKLSSGMIPRNVTTEIDKTSATAFGNLVADIWTVLAGATDSDDD